MPEPNGLRELDVVRVRELSRPDQEFAGSENIKRPPRLGDIGTIVHDYVTSGTRAFIVECVDTNGGTIWLADFDENELEAIGGDTAG